MKTLNQKEVTQLEEAFYAICHLSLADSKDNISKCSCYHTKPFHTHWDKKTVDEVMYNIKLYIDSWVIHPMEQALKFDKSKVKKEAIKRHKERKTVLAEWLKNQPKNNP